MMSKKRNVNVVDYAKSMRAMEFEQLFNCTLHDIAGSLTAINLNLALLDAGLDHENLALRSSLAGLHQIKQIISSFRSTVPEYSLQRFNPDAEILNVLELFRYRAVHAGVRVCYQNAQGLITGNPSEFNRVVFNLLQNSIEAFPAKQTDKIINIISEHKDTDYKLSLQDNGSGIAAEHIAKIFDLGFSTKAAGEEHGTGLYYVQKVVQEHFQGSLTVQSSLDTGTEFRIIIPRR